MTRDVLQQQQAPLRDALQYPTGSVPRRRAPRTLSVPGSASWRRPTAPGSEQAARLGAARLDALCSVAHPRR